jgi:hypothetical protein
MGTRLRVRRTVGEGREEGWEGGGESREEGWGCAVAIDKL